MKTQISSSFRSLSLLLIAISLAHNPLAESKYFVIPEVAELDLTSYRVFLRQNTCVSLCTDAGVEKCALLSRTGQYFDELPTLRSGLGLNEFRPEGPIEEASEFSNCFVR